MKQYLILSLAIAALVGCATHKERDRGWIGGEDWFWRPIGQPLLPTDVRALAAVADDSTQDRRSRCDTIFAIFANHVRPGCTSTELASVLGEASWLKDAELSSGISGSGWWPIFPKGDESIFNIRLFPKDEAWGDVWEIYVIVSRPSSPPDPCCPDVDPLAFLRGAVNDRSVRIREFVLCHPSGVFKTFTTRKVGVLFQPGAYEQTAQLLDLHYGYLYLHIPDNEEWPESQWVPDGRISTNRYSKISRVTRVNKVQYEQDLKQAKILFPELHSGSHFYATERSADTDGQRLLLERKAYP